MFKIKVDHLTYNSYYIEIYAYASTTYHECIYAWVDLVVVIILHIRRGNLLAFESVGAYLLADDDKGPKRAIDISDIVIIDEYREWPSRLF